MSSVSSLRERLTQQEEGIATQLKVLGQETLEQINQHGLEIMGLMKKNIDPVTTYLNSMHVKLDGAQQQLRGLDSRVPALEARVSEVVEALESRQRAQQDEALEAQQRLDGLSRAVTAHGERLGAERRAWAAEL